MCYELSEFIPYSQDEHPERWYWAYYFFQIPPVWDGNKRFGDFFPTEEEFFAERQSYVLCIAPV